MKWYSLLFFLCISLFVHAEEPKAGVIREYEHSLTQAEKNDISYIVKTLANKSLAKVFKNRSTLERCGDRVNHVHPLRFLECIFTDEELKVAIRNLKKRGWAWKEFFPGLKESLQDESNNNNMRVEYVSDFTQILDADFDAVYSMTSTYKWLDLMNWLITNIPREGNNGRYDM